MTDKKERNDDDYATDGNSTHLGSVPTVCPQLDITLGGSVDNGSCCI